MFLFYVPSFFKKGDTIQEGTLLKGGHCLRKYGIYQKGNSQPILAICKYILTLVLSNLTKNQKKSQAKIGQN